MTKITLLLCSLLFTITANAGAIAVGKPLVSVNISENGEILLNGNEYIFKPWSSQSLTGKVHVLQYMAATTSASKVNEAFTDALKTANFPHDKEQITTVLNLDDALWGTSGFVISELERNKRKYPLAGMVADKEGIGLKTWGLRSDGCAIVVIDKRGTVLFFKEGALSNDEIQSTLALMRNNL